MSYCTNADVAAEFKNLTYNSNTVSSTKVDEWISQIDGYINGKIGQVYLTPVTGTEAVKIVKTISIYLVASRVEKALITKTGNAQTDQTSKSEKSFYEMGMDMLKEIVNQDVELSDATKVSSSDGVSSYAQTSGEEHIFKKGTTQW